MPRIKNGSVEFVWEINIGIEMSFGQKGCAKIVVGKIVDWEINCFINVERTKQKQWKKWIVFKDSTFHRFLNIPKEPNLAFCKKYETATLKMPKP